MVFLLFISKQKFRSNNKNKYNSNYFVTQKIIYETLSLKEYLYSFQMFYFQNLSKDYSETVALFTPNHNSILSQLNVSLLAGKLFLLAN